MTTLALKAHLAINVHDVTASIRFYRKALWGRAVKGPHRLCQIRSGEPSPKPHAQPAPLP